jgi:hypothetical protein
MDEIQIRAQLAAIRAEQLEHQNTAKAAMRAAQQCIGAYRAFEMMLEQIKQTEAAKQAEAAKLADAKAQPEIHATEEAEMAPDSPTKGKK